MILIKEMLLHKNEIDHGAQSNKDDYYYLMVANYYIIYDYPHYLTDRTLYE